MLTTSQAIYPKFFAEQMQKNLKFCFQTFLISHTKHIMSLCICIAAAITQLVLGLMVAMDPPIQVQPRRYTSTVIVAFISKDTVTVRNKIF